MLSLQYTLSIHVISYPLKVITCILQLWSFDTYKQFQSRIHEETLVWSENARVATENHTQSQAWIILNRETIPLLHVRLKIPFKHDVNIVNDNTMASPLLSFIYLLA